MKSEQFLKLYLEEHKLKYNLKNDIYLIKLDASHKKWFNAEEIKVTFNPKITKKGVTLLTKGHSMINTLVMQHLDDIPIASLKIKDDKDGLVELNERLTEINELNALYQIDEKNSKCVFTYFEVIVNTAKKKSIFKIPLLEIEGNIIDATGIEEANFIETKELPSPEKKHLKLLDELSNILKVELKELWDQHHKDMDELVEIQHAYNDQRFNDLEKKESLQYNKIEDKESDKVSASTFDRQAKLADDIRRLKSKYNDLVEANKEKRSKITEDSEVQIESLKNRDLNTSVDILAYAEIDIPYYEVRYENNDKYLFLPCLHKFVKIK